MGHSALPPSPQTLSYFSSSKHWGPEKTCGKRDSPSVENVGLPDESRRATTQPKNIRLLQLQQTLGPGDDLREMRQPVCRERGAAWWVTARYYPTHKHRDSNRTWEKCRQPTRRTGAGCLMSHGALLPKPQAPLRTSWLLSSRVTLSPCISGLLHTNLYWSIPVVGRTVIAQN
jgi:hypothetical protein